MRVSASAGAGNKEADPRLIMGIGHYGTPCPSSAAGLGDVSSLGEHGPFFEGCVWCVYPAVGERECVFGLFDLLLYESSYGAYLINRWRWSWGCQLQGVMDAFTTEKHKMWRFPGTYGVCISKHVSEEFQLIPENMLSKRRGWRRCVGIDSKKAGSPPPLCGVLTSAERRDSTHANRVGE